MPCDSRITVYIEDMNRLEQALKALGYTIDQKTAALVRATKGNTTIAISSRSAIGNREAISEAARKYAELGVRQYAKKKGYTITMSDKRTLVLTKRGS